LATPEVDASEFELKLKAYYLLIILIAMMFVYQLIFEIVIYMTMTPEQESWFKKLIEYFVPPPKPWYKFW